MKYYIIIGFLIVGMLVFFTQGNAFKQETRKKAPSEIGNDIKEENKEEKVSFARELLQPFLKDTILVEEAEDGSVFSKIGGLPEVNQTFEWPMYKGKPMSFLAQFDLSEMPHGDLENPLPHEGYLYFFYDQDGYAWGMHDDLGGWRVFYQPEESKMVLLEAPQALAKEAIFGESKVRFVTSPSYPPWESDIIEGLNLTDKGLDDYIDFLDGIEESGTISKVLGHPNQIQNDIQVECEMESRGITYETLKTYNEAEKKDVFEAAKDWVLLFQLDSIDDNGMMWGDCGRLYFWIKEEDLSKGDFSKVWMILQCY